MIAICEECGKKYQIDPGKIKGEQAKFKCKACGHINLIVKRPMEPPPPPEPVLEPTPPMESPSQGIVTEIPKGPDPSEEKTAEERKSPKISGLRLEGIGLRGKMMILFLLVPSLFIATAGVLYLKQLESLSSLLTEESTRVVTRMAENAIGETARSVARECKLFLTGHPGFKKEILNQDGEFRGIAIQKVGSTGYTAFYELPGPDNVWRTWAHVNAKIVGIDMSQLKKPMGSNFPGFWAIYSRVKEGKESSGYYTWQEKDGSFKEKYMVCTPVEGTPFIVAATTYLDEFTKDITQLQTEARHQTLRTRNIILGILCGTLLVITLTVSLYGHRLTGKIKSLTEVTDRISVGDLEASIRIESKDEIGALAEAISRMQDSIRLSIERLRRRR